MSERADREGRTARRAATLLVAIFVALWASRWILALGVGLSNEYTGTANSSYFLIDLVVTMLAGGLFIAVGWTIVTRQPRNTIGWLLIAIPLTVMLSVAVGDYATAALKTRPGTLPFGVAAAWLDRWLIVVALGMFIPIFLLFPDGKLPSRRWRPVLWLLIGSFAITITSFAITPGQLTGAFADIADVGVTNPLGIQALAGPLNVITQIAVSSPGRRSSCGTEVHRRRSGNRSGGSPSSPPRSSSRSSRRSRLRPSSGTPGSADRSGTSCSGSCRRP